MELATYGWLPGAYSPVSAARRPGESRFLTPDGHVLHINFNINGKFFRYCEQNDIVVFCLPPHSTHPLQPLGVGLFHSFRPTVAPQSSRRLLPYNNIGINRDLFFPTYKQARVPTYTVDNITSALKKCGIVPFNPTRFLVNPHYLQLRAGPQH